MNGDARLVQIVENAMAEAARRSAGWLACRPGCSQCCIGPFPITPLDVLRLREGLGRLRAGDPERAAAVRRRASSSAERIRQAFPDHPVARVLSGESAFDEEACPALDPETGTCDLYASRPITCRTFGPAVRFGAESVGVCELCYQGATDAQIAACEVEIDLEGMEAELLRDMPGGDEQAIVAFALAAEP